MGIKKQSNLNSGDIVETIKSERDIEYIPAGIKIVLTRKNGEMYWYGEGVIDGMKRSLLVFAKNLRLVKKANIDLAISVSSK